MKIAITGATGQLGRLVAAQLPQAIALVRDVQKATDLQNEARAFDYNAPAPEALTGVDTLLLISGNAIGQRSTQHKAVIDAAKTAGVKHIVYTSLLHADTSGLILAQEHLETEEYLKASGIPYTVLRNGWYTENYTAGLGAALAGGKILGSAGEGKIAAATRADYAAAAVKVLQEPSLQGKTYELAGDHPFTLKEYAAAVSRVSGKNIPYENLSEEDHAKALEAGGMPAGFASVMAGFDQGAKRGDLDHKGNELSTLIGRPTTSLEDAVSAAI